MITLPIGLVVAVALGTLLLVVGLLLESRMLRRALTRMRRDRDLALAEERVSGPIAEACGTTDVDEAARRVRDWRETAEGRNGAKGRGA
jgi:hypothetical protein